MTEKRDVEIRLARPGDAVSEVRPDDRQYIKRALTAGNCFAAFFDSRPVGYAVLDYTFYDNGFVPSLFVEASFRRRGIGASLMARLEAECQTNKLFTSTNLSNQPMQSLLAKRRYSLTGFIDNLDPGDPEPVSFLAVSNTA